MFMTPLILHFAFSPLQSAWRKLTDQQFEYQALDEQSKNNYHAIVAMCDDYVFKIHSQLNIFLLRVRCLRIFRYSAITLLCLLTACAPQQSTWLDHALCCIEEKPCVCGVVYRENINVRE